LIKGNATLDQSAEPNAGRGSFTNRKLKSIKSYGLLDNNETMTIDSCSKIWLSKHMISKKIK